jgi:hypothetical protein
MRLRAICATALLALWAGNVLAQDSKSQPPETKAAGTVVPYCIEPMESMPQKLVDLIEPQFRCEIGTHLKRDSRPARVVPSGEEALGRPFVLRFDRPEKANAWYVRGYTTEQ